MEKKLNKCLLVAFVLGLAYTIYLIVYFGGAAANSKDDVEAISAGIATVLIMPHLVMTALATIFNGLGLLLKKSGFALTGGILYTVALVLFIPYFFFVIIQMILSFVGFSQLKKNKE